MTQLIGGVGHVTGAGRARRFGCFDFIVKAAQVDDTPTYVDLGTPLPRRFVPGDASVRRRRSIRAASVLSITNPRHGSQIGAAVVEFVPVDVVDVEDVSWFEPKQLAMHLDDQGALVSPSNRPDRIAFSDVPTPRGDERCVSSIDQGIRSDGHVGGGERHAHRPGGVRLREWQCVSRLLSLPLGTAYDTTRLGAVGGRRRDGHWSVADQAARFGPTRQLLADDGVSTRLPTRFVGRLTHARRVGAKRLAALGAHYNQRTLSWEHAKIRLHRGTSIPHATPPAATTARGFRVARIVPDWGAA